MTLCAGGRGAEARCFGEHLRQDGVESRRRGLDGETGRCRRLGPVDHGRCGTDALAAAGERGTSAPGSGRLRALPCSRARGPLPGCTVARSSPGARNAALGRATAHLPVLRPRRSPAFCCRPLVVGGRAPKASAWAAARVSNAANPSSTKVGGRRRPPRFGGVGRIAIIAPPPP